jgi:hypothetical protein
MLTQTNESGPRAEDTRAAKTLSPVEGTQAMTHLTKLQRRYGVDKPYAPAAFAAIIERHAQAARRERIAREDADAVAVTWIGGGGSLEDFLGATEIERRAMKTRYPEIVAAMQAREAVLAS